MRRLKQVAYLPIWRSWSAGRGIGVRGDGGVVVDERDAEGVPLARPRRILRGVTLMMTTGWLTWFCGNLLLGA